MKEFVFPAGRIFTDPAANRAWYDTYGAPAGGCDCAYCRNFLAAVEQLPKDVRNFMDSLGVDLRKPDEAVQNEPRADGLHWYSAWYHLSGTLVEEGVETALAENCTYWFQSVSYLQAAHFPTPHFQLNLELCLPWLLEEPWDGTTVK